MTRNVMKRSPQSLTSIIFRRFALDGRKPKTKLPEFQWNLYKVAIRRHGTPIGLDLQRRARGSRLISFDSALLEPQGREHLPIRR